MLRPTEFTNSSVDLDAPDVCSSQGRSHSSLPCWYTVSNSTFVTYTSHLLGTNSTIASSAARMAIYIIYIVNAFAQSDGETLITYLLFWTMIECGLGLIVVCLPTLRSIYGKLSPRSIFSGIRSALAHQSLRSSSHISPGATRLDSLDKSGKSETSVANLYNKDEGTTQTYIVGAHDLEQQYTFPRAAIQVRSEVEQH